MNAQTAALFVSAGQGDRPKMLYVVGRTKAAEPGTWELQGVYSRPELAEAACRGRDYFVGPCLLDVPMPEESVEWPGLYRPRCAGDPT